MNNAMDAGVSADSPLATMEERDSRRGTSKREQKKIFQANFRRELARYGRDIHALARESGVDLQTLRRWRREGVAQPEHEHIERVARVFGLADPWSLLHSGDGGRVEIRDRRALDRLTNPAVDEVRRRIPDLFASFSTEDWDELFSQHGTGGPLTPFGVEEAARKIQRKRELRRKFEAVLETHHFQTLSNLIDVLYRDTEVRSMRDAR